MTISSKMRSLTCRVCLNACFEAAQVPSKAATNPWGGLAFSEAECKLLHDPGPSMSTLEDLPRPSMGHAVSHRFRHAKPLFRSHGCGSRAYPSLSCLRQAGLLPFAFSTDFWGWMSASRWMFHPWNRDKSHRSKPKGLQELHSDPHGSEHGQMAPRREHPCALKRTGVGRGCPLHVSVWCVRGRVGVCAHLVHWASLGLFRSPKAKEGHGRSLNTSHKIVMLMFQNSNQRPHRLCSR